MAPRPRLGLKQCSETETEVMFKVETCHIRSWKAQRMRKIWRQDDEQGTKTGLGFLVVGRKLTKRQKKCCEFVFDCVTGYTYTAVPKLKAVGDPLCNMDWYSQIAASERQILPALYVCARPGWALV